MAALPYPILTPLLSDDTQKPTDEYMIWAYISGFSLNINLQPLFCFVTVDLPPLSWINFHQAEHHHHHQHHHKSISVIRKPLGSL